MDYSLPDSPVHGTLQARTLEWESFPSPGDLYKLEPGSPAKQEDSLPTEPAGKPQLSEFLQFLHFP